MKVLANLRCDLAIGHLVDGLNGNDVSTELVSLEALFQFAFGLTGTKQQEGFSTTNRRDHLIVVLVQMTGKLPLVTIIGWHLL